jgi:alpha-amylase
MFLALRRLASGRFALPLVFAASVARPAAASVIYQAFEERFDDLAGKVDHLADAGYDFIQVSPPQKSVDQPIWWARYQPIDYRVIAGPLGDEAALRRLVAKAHGRGVRILADVVLNHMADPHLFGDGSLHYPEFSPWDFHDPDRRPCIQDFGDRYQVTHFWLCGDPEHPERGLPDLDTGSAYVRGVHKKFLRKLVDLGVDGVRIDAAKHIEPEYFDDVLSVLPPSALRYGEVIGTTLDESRLYTSKMLVTDFHLLGTLINAFSADGDLTYLRYPEGFGAALPSTQSVTLVRPHDAVMSPSFFNFGDYRDAVLAYAYAVGRGNGVTLVYRDDAYEDTVAAAVRFHRAMRGKLAYVRPVGEVCGGQTGCDDRTLLVLEREGEGVVVINKANAWVDIAEARMPGLAEGCYRELRYGTQMTVGRGGDGQKWVTSWGSRARGGLQIGPRSALFFAAAKGCE